MSQQETDVGLGWCGEMDAMEVLLEQLMESVDEMREEERASGRVRKQEWWCWPTASTISSPRAHQTTSAPAPVKPVRNRISSSSSLPVLSHVFAFLSSSHCSAPIHWATYLYNMCSIGSS